MRILLVGEYNRTHKSLKEGLVELGHTAVVVGLSDGFKKVDVDIEIKHRFRKGFRKKYRSLISRIFKVDVYGYDVLKQLKSLESELSGFDVIQFVNESSFLCLPDTERKIFDLLVSWNKNPFLLSCGTDYPSVKYAFDKKFRYSILTPYFDNKLRKSDFSLGLKYLQPEFIKLHEYLYSKVKGVISCDLDYSLPLEGHEKHLGLIPHVINTTKIKYLPLKTKGKITIFHGINRTNYYKKGNDFFEKALNVIQKKYPEKVEIVIVESIPYAEYIKAIDDAHILLDQVYAYDQGYNALEGMAKGKVVFTGAEKEWLKHYQLKEDTIAINAVPDTNKIVEKLNWLIENPDKLIEISKNTREFVEREHGHLVCAKRYLKKWSL